jgi:peptidoglycan/LPS O-acetylase OafA/YrhL
VLAHGYAFKENLTFKSFFTSRFFRLFPLHVTMLFVFILLEFGKLVASNHGINFNNIPFSGTTSPFEIVPNFFLLQSWTSYTNQLSFNGPSWSISIEFYVYMIFFVFLLIKTPLRYLAWGIIVAITGGFIIADSKILLSAVTSGLSCFFAGSLTYVCYKYTQNKINIKESIFTILEFLIFIFVVVVVSSDIGSKSLIPSLIFCISIFIFSFEKGLLSNLLKKKIFSFLGKLSYSIYMTHTAILFCLILFFMILQKFLGVELAPVVEGIRYVNIGNSFVNNMFIILTLGLVVLVSNFTYKFVEQPGQRLGKKISSSFSETTNAHEELLNLKRRDITETNSSV